MRKPIQLLAIATVLLTSTACTALDDAMVFVFGRSMRSQASFDPYENPLPPAEGAVSFSSGNFPSGPGATNYGAPTQHSYDVPDFDASFTVRNDPMLDAIENPVPSDAASLERGEEMFLRVCAPCHADTGIGADANLQPVWPALVAYDLAGPTVQGMSDGYIYGMIRVGRGIMPSYGHQVTHFDRWNIVNYVRQLQAEYNAAQGVVAGEGN